MLCGCALSVGRPSWIGRSGTAQLLFLGVAAYFSVQLHLSGATNGEYPGKISLLEVGYLAYLPTIYWLTPTSVSQVRTYFGSGRQLCMAIVYTSLALAVVAPHVAFVGNRRLVIGSLHERLAGVTPHPNLLSAVAALGLLLSLHARQGRLRRRAFPWPRLGSQSRERPQLRYSHALSSTGSSRDAWLPHACCSRHRCSSLRGVPRRSWYRGDFVTTSRLATGASSSIPERTSGISMFAHAGAKPTLGWGPFAFSNKASTPFSLSQTCFLTLTTNSFRR